MTRRRNTSFRTLAILFAFVFTATSLSWARELQLLVSSRRTNNVLRYDAGTGRFLGVFNKADHETQHLNNPKAMALAPDGLLYVVRGFPKNDIVRLDSAGRFRGVVLSSDPAKLELPRGLAFRRDGSLYLSDRDGNRVLSLSSNGSLRVFIANGTKHGLEMPRSLAFDPGDRYLYVASRKNQSILQYDAKTGRLLKTLSLPEKNLLAGQRHMRFGPDGYLYATSYDNHGILKFDATGAFVSKVVSGGRLVGPKGIAFGPEGDLYVTSHSARHSCVLRYTTEGTFTNEFVSRDSNGGLDDPTDVVFAPVSDAK